MKLEAGYYYKLVEKGSGLDGKCHIVRVFNKNGRQYYRMDHGDEYELNEETQYNFEDMMIAFKSKEPLPKKASNLRLKFLFNDENNDPYEFVARSSVVARQIVDLFPAIKRAFGVKKSGGN